MRALSKTQLARFRQVHGLVDAEHDGPNVLVAAGELGGAIQRLTDHGERQEQYDRDVRARTVELRQQAQHLRTDVMVPVQLAARAIYPVGDEVGASVRQAVRPPKHRADYEHVALSARGLAAAVEPRAKEFISKGLPADFIAQLRDGATALEKAVNERAAAFQRRLAATQGIVVETRRGIALVKLLHALLKPRLRGDLPRATEWKRAVMVPRRSGGGALVESQTEAPAPEVVVDRAA